MSNLFEWVCTDPDTNQYGRRLSDNFYEFRQNGTGTIRVELTNIKPNEMEAVLNAYGYTNDPNNTREEFDYGTDVLDKNWIMAECWFEFQVNSFQLALEAVKSNRSPLAEYVAPLTIEQLKAFDPETVFATGLVKDSRLEKVTVRWIAVRGGHWDWSIYYDRDGMTAQEVAEGHSSVKVTNPAIIRELVKTDDLAFQMYRF